MRGSGRQDELVRNSTVIGEYGAECLVAFENIVEGHLQRLDV